jgi:predicted aldo/keto reductase-like oxidoreductase
MTIFDGEFPLGLGTNRFPIKSAADEEGIERSVRIVLRAMEAGVSFVDLAHTYSRGMALEVFRRAFKRRGPMGGITIKTRLDIDRRADDVRRRADDVLNTLEMSKANYLYFWSLTSFAEYEAMLGKGGAYEGAQKLKDEGLIDHICFSTHAPVADIIKIMKTGAFEAVTISFNLLSALRYGEVLQTARELGIGVAAMNPLGGGLIPNNEEYFAFAKNAGDEDAASAALRYVLAHEDIQIAITGVSSLEELEKNLAVAADPCLAPEKPERRAARVNASIKSLPAFCTGCGYCAGCPAGIPAAQIMQCRNSLNFEPSDRNYDFAPEYVRQNIFAVGKLEQDHSILFETTENPCVLCGECERKCTQGLKIAEGVADTYKRAEYSAWSRRARIKRLEGIIDNSPGNTVGLYPSGITSLTIRRFYEDNIGGLRCGLVAFDGNPAVWGSADNGVKVYAPEDIPRLRPSVVIITSYKFKNEIYEAIRQYGADGIKIVKLSGDNELPWLL